MVNEVFKYVPPERIDILESKRVCFSKKEQLNDTFEFELKFKVAGGYNEDLDFFIEEYFLSQIESPNMKELLSYQASMEKKLNKKLTTKEYMIHLANSNSEIKKIINEGLDSINEDYIKAVKDKVCVLSLTHRCNSNYMWGHYASSSKGFMIGFDKENVFFNKKNSENDLIRQLKDVIYVDEAPVLYINNDLNDNEKISHYMFHNKHTDHEQENECRIVDIIDNASVITENGFYLFDIPKNLITSITFGCHISTTDEIKIRNLIENDDYFDGVTMYKAIPNTNTRKIDRYKIVE
ncbi:DUF2971 domain-containing protein [Providencia rettgeri]|uniref:DUF2971 domain-containing protein n=1 Tax=Providencia rettgeri TaxID=587 RepID=UPI000D7DD891|nr:DUF2971 domain-containing protein [Providencia rettgeri]AWS52272.1 hypothetical protein AM461_16320 [Providencia rettgeri]HEM6844630.1 DUF2971 domain-containing protein [Providencia rettgeri]